MPVRITLRTDNSYSPFKEMLKLLINCPLGDSLLLCSGYIQEDLWDYRILEEDLLDNIKTGCSKGVLITVAGKLTSNDWKKAYINFIEHIKKADIKIYPCISPKLNWHAKIAMRLATTSTTEKKRPIAGLLGSSNLTKPAWDESETPYWNFEGDVLIWPSNDELDIHFGHDFKPKVPYGDMRLVLDEKIEQYSEKEQLAQLYKHITESGLETFRYK